MKINCLSKWLALYIEAECIFSSITAVVEAIVVDGIVVVMVVVVMG